MVYYFLRFGAVLLPMALLRVFTDAVAFRDHSPWSLNGPARDRSLHMVSHPPLSLAGWPGLLYTVAAAPKGERSKRTNPDMAKLNKPACVHARHSGCDLFCLLIYNEHFL